MVISMPRCSHRLLAICMLVLMVFVFALGGCVLACADDDRVCAGDDSTQCSCPCQMPVLVSLGDIVVPDLDVRKFVPAPIRLKLRLIVSSIFQPPRV